MSDIRPRLDTEQAGYDHWTGVYRTNEESIRVKLTFERISDGDNGALWCEARAIIQIDDKPRAVIPPSRTNLMNASRSGTGWKGLVGTLSDMASEIRWDEAVAEGVSKAISHYRNGERERELKVDEITPEHPFLLEPFIASSGTSVFYGEGGTGKSMIALGMAVIVASGFPLFGHIPRITGPVMYFDYEDDPNVHEERLSAILSGANVTLQYPIYHRSLVAKVSQSQSSMRRSITDRDATLAILDSVGMGRGGSATGAEDTIRLFRALRSLNVPVLAVDHVTKEDKREREVISPYGSIYTVNSARLLWGAVSLGDETSSAKHLRLTNTKTNRTERYQPLGMTVEYGNTTDHKTGSRHLESVVFKVHDLFWQRITSDPWDQIFAYLSVNREEHRTATEIAMNTGLDHAEVLVKLTEHDDEISTKTRGSKEMLFWLTTKSDELFEEGEEDGEET